MSRYLDEAAALLRQAADANEKTYGDRSPGIQGRERIAQQFATLAAIDKGLLPADITADILRAITDRQAA